MIKNIIKEMEEKYVGFIFNNFIEDYLNGESREKLCQNHNVTELPLRIFCSKLGLAFVKSRRASSFDEFKYKLGLENGEDIKLVKELEKDIETLSKKNRKLYHSLTIARDEANALRRESRNEARALTDDEARMDILETSIYNMLSKLNIEYRNVPMVSTKNFNKDTLTMYPYTDLHIGMLALAESSGYDFDLKIAEDWILGSFDHLMSVAPDSETCLIAEMGDLLHASDDRKETKSGHQLDVDSRHHKIIDTTFEIMIQLVERALTKHKYVKVVSISGNHSENSSFYLKAVLKAYFRNEPRVEIIQGSRLVQYYRFGTTLLGWHHGHTIRSTTKLTECMISDNIDIFSNTKYRYWHIGHLHSNSVQVSKEDALCSIEIHKNLPPRDAWADGAGYRGNVGEVKAITYHKEYGEIARNLFKIDMLEGKG